MNLRVASANWYYANKQPVRDAHFLVNFDPDIVGVQEGHGGNAQDIKNALKGTHETFWGKPADKAKAYGALDVPVFYKKRLKVIRRWSRQVSKRASVKDLGMPRAATIVRFEKDGVNVTFVNTHLNAAVQGSAGKPLTAKIKRVFEFIQSIIVLEAIIRRAQRRGDLVVVVGDMNFRKTNAGVWKFSPIGLFNRTKLNYREVGLDYIAFSKRFKASNFKVIPTSQTGSDHPWLLLDLSA